jgi:hypothetical protein
MQRSSICFIIPQALPGRKTDLRGIPVNDKEIVETPQILFDNFV